MNDDFQIPAATFRPPSGEIPVFEPINLTEQIPLEYAVLPAGPAAVLDADRAAQPGLPFGPLPERPVSKTPRPATIVWGFIVLAIGLGSLASALGQTIDFGLAAIWLLSGAGLALVLAAVGSALRKSARAND